MEEAATIASKIKTRSIEGGTTLGHLAIVIPEDEYQLEIEDNTWVYEEPEYPGAYNPDITGNENDHVVRRMEAEHKEKLADYQNILESPSTSANNSRRVLMRHGLLP